MSAINQDELRAALDTAINGKLVVQSWLGYAEVLPHFGFVRAECSD